MTLQPGDGFLGVICRETGDVLHYNQTEGKGTFL